MNLTSSLVIISVAALIHASFQLSVSMLTLLSSHTIGRKRSHAKLVTLTNSFLVGAAVMTTLLISFTAFGVSLYLNYAHSPAFLWTVGCGLVAGLGLAVWLFYYRRHQGTTLWIPRELARFLSSRAKKTHGSGEAFSLGLTSVVSEVLFIAAPTIIAALAIAQLSPTWQLGGLAIYVLISLFPLVIVTGLIGSGHSISRIQKWRETNKNFLQFAAGAGLIVLGVYVYVDQVVTETVIAAARSI